MYKMRVAIAALSIVASEGVAFANMEEPTPLRNAEQLRGVWEGFEDGTVYILDLRIPQAPLLTTMTPNMLMPEVYVLGCLKVEKSVLHTSGVRLDKDELQDETVDVRGTGLASRDTGRLEVTILWRTVMLNVEHRIDFYRQGYFSLLVTTSATSVRALDVALMEQASAIARMRGKLMRPVRPGSAPALPRRGARARQK